VNSWSRLAVAVGVSDNTIMLLERTAPPMLTSVIVKHVRQCFALDI